MVDVINNNPAQAANYLAQNPGYGGTVLNIYNTVTSANLTSAQAASWITDTNTMGYTVSGTSIAPPEPTITALNGTVVTLSEAKAGLANLVNTGMSAGEIAVYCRGLGFSAADIALVARSNGINITTEDVNAYAANGSQFWSL